MSISAGQKLTADRLNALETAVVARHKRTTSATTTTQTTGTSAQGVCRLDDVALKAGRLYRITAHGGAYLSTSGRNKWRLTYTTDGSTPAANSTVLRDIQHNNPGSDIVLEAEVSGTYTPGSDLSFSVLFSHYVSTGTGGVFGSSDWPVELVIEDLGTDPGSTGTNI